MSPTKSCKGCHESITDGQAYRLGTDQWHVSCFKCSKCSKSLGVNSNFLVLGTGSLVCSDCSYTCKSCSKKIYDLAILTGDLAYCADCFKCKACNKPIEDLKYARTSKGLFCIPCHNILIEKKRKYEKMKKLKASKELNKKVENDNSASSNKSLASIKKKLINAPSSKSPTLPPIPQTPPFSSSSSSSPNTVNPNISTTTASNISNTKSVELNRSKSEESRSNSNSNSNSNSKLINNSTNLSIDQSLNSSGFNKPSYLSTSSSTFDVDFYADSDTQNKNDMGSSVYSKYDTRSNNSSADLQKIDSSPIEKFDVVMDFDIDSSAKLSQNDNVYDSPNTLSAPVEIPSLKHENMLSYMHQDDKDSELSIPLRSPRRSNLSPVRKTAISPVRNTTQFRTPELDTPKKKIVTAELLSPGNKNKTELVIGHETEKEPEKEPESFINFDDETEEESMFSIAESFNKDDEQKTPKISSDSNSGNPSGLMSPLRYSTSNKMLPQTNAGLNIEGLDPKYNPGYNQNEIKSKKTSSIDKFETPTGTPEQSQHSFDPNTTPNSRKKQVGGLGRSLTKVFGRNKKTESKEFNDQVSTPETITSHKNSPVHNFTPKAHTRTYSSHSSHAYTTPPVTTSGGHSRTRSDHSFTSYLPKGSSNKNHSRSISESTTFDANIQSFTIEAEKELNLLKNEINSLTLSKATLLKDIQNLKAHLKSLEADLNEKQKLSKELDVAILNKRKASYSTTNTNDETSISSGKYSSKEDVSNMKLSSTDELLTSEFQPAPNYVSSSSSANMTANSAPSSSSTNVTSLHNPYHQPSSSNMSKDKRGFMRRLFGAHSTVNSAGSNQSSGSSNLIGQANGKQIISQPMNVRHEDIFTEQIIDQSPSSVSTSSTNNNSKIDSANNSTIKPSKSSNFLQWRNNNNSANNDTGLKHLYSMSLQELSIFEGGDGIPFIVKTCLAEVEKRGSQVEGIYRISGSASLVDKIENYFDTLDVKSDEITKMSFVHDSDIHALAGLLKRYLKNIPDAIIPQAIYSQYVNISKLDGELSKIKKLSEILSLLPNANITTLYALTQHLSLIADNEKWTKMNSSSLATVFAPTLVRHNSLHPHQEIQDTKAKTEVTEILFKNYKSVFNNID